MYFSKTLLICRKLNIHSIQGRTNLSAIQSSIIKRCCSTKKSSVEEAGEPEASSLADEKKELEGPFAKNLFAGIFNSAFLEYPEYPNLESVKDLEKLTNPVEEYILNCVDSIAIDEKQEIPDDVINTLRKHKLYGLTVPQKFGGLELDDRCLARYSEAIGCDSNISTSLAAHNRALYVVLLHGSEYQKNKYLEKLASGETIFGFCMVENPTLFDADNVETVALPNESGDWVINGKKIWVVNGVKADTFVVFAKTWQGDMRSDQNSLLTVFLIDKNTPGVSCSSPIEQMGTTGIEVCDVSFDNVVVKKEYLVGEPGFGSEIAFECLSRGRLGASASAVGFLKYLYNMLLDYSINTKVSGKAFSSFEYVERTLGSIASDIYALESMVYLTAGIKDTYNNPDLSVEESIVKVYSMEKVVEIVDLCANLVGGYSYIKGSPFENFIRDSRSYLLHDIIPINVTKIFISSLGLQHAGMIFKNDVKKSRNPFDFPGFVLTNLWKERNVLNDEVKIPEILRLQLHPTLSKDADKLESCLIRLEAVVKNLLRRWGLEVIDKQMDLIRLANVVISMYAMTAVLGRASRSYCIGLANADSDVLLTNVLCSKYFEQIKNDIDNLFVGPVESFDAGFRMIGEKAVSKKCYYFEHPLARNY